MRRQLWVLVLGGILIAATPETTGGWAVVTLLDVPEYLEVGTPTTISFKIRQHGVEVMRDRSPSLVLGHAEAGFISRMLSRDRVPARKADARGVYEATIIPKKPGDLRITVDTDLFGWEVRLLPFQVVAAENHPPAFVREERGRQLFAAKGCMTCHVKRDDPSFAEGVSVGAGPELTSRTFPDDYLRMKLENPAESRVPGRFPAPMPELKLDAPEIEALVAYINGVAEMTTTDGG